MSESQVGHMKGARQTAPLSSHDEIKIVWTNMETSATECRVRKWEVLICGPRPGRQTELEKPRWTLRWTSLRWTSLRCTPPPRTVHNFAFFSPFPPQISFCHLSLRVSSWNCGRGSRPWTTQRARLGSLSGPQLRTTATIARGDPVREK